MQIVVGKKTSHSKFKQKAIMSRPQTRQLISGPLSSELDLIEFLRPYKRVRNNSVCKMSLDASQVTVWVFKHGEWLRGMPKNTMKSGSWCQSYLTAMLKLSTAQYEAAKKGMFSAQDGLNGVYAHESEPKFALVYRPPQKWSNSTKAAMAGGAALAGLAGTYALRNRSNRAQPAAKPSQIVTQTVDLDKLDDIARDLAARLADETHVQNNDKIDEYKKFVDGLEDAIVSELKISSQEIQKIRAKQSPTTDIERRVYAIFDTEDKVRKQLQKIERLAAIGSSQKGLSDLFEPSKTYDAIINSGEWKTADNEMSNVLKELKDTDRYDKAMAANHFNRVMRRAQDKDQESIDNYLHGSQGDIQKLIEVAKLLKSKEFFDAIDELIANKVVSQKKELLWLLYRGKLELDQSDSKTQKALNDLKLKEPLLDRDLRRYVEKRRGNQQKWQKQFMNSKKDLDSLDLMYETLKNFNRSGKFENKSQAWTEFKKKFLDLEKLKNPYIDLSKYSRLHTLLTNLAAIPRSPETIQNELMTGDYIAVGNSGLWTENRVRLTGYVDSLVDQKCKSSMDMDNSDCRLFHRVMALQWFNDMFTKAFYVQKKGDEQGEAALKKLIETGIDTIRRVCPTLGNCPYYDAMVQFLALIRNAPKVTNIDKAVLVKMLEDSIQIASSKS
jgi:hypothetical protein